MLGWIDLNSDSAFFLEMLDVSIDDLFCSPVWESELHDVGLVDDSVEVVGNGVIGLKPGVGRGICSLYSLVSGVFPTVYTLQQWTNHNEVEHKG